MTSSAGNRQAMEREASRTFSVAASIWVVAVEMNRILLVTTSTPWEALCMLEEISRVTTDCSSTAEEMLVEMSLI